KRLLLLNFPPPPPYAAYIEPMPRGDIAILFIGIGRYIGFFDDFYANFEKYFLVNLKKHYFVFSDFDSKSSYEFECKTAKNVSLIATKKMSWPYPTLLRYHMFCDIGHLLDGFNMPSF
ncbi:MAG: hypothetical protein E7K04_03795, partial [Helicobacter sp.]|nr:hypothetical protein [Helicobacter sp.]